MRLFEKAGHKIVLGDALEVLRTEIKDRSIHLIFADPPYNIGKNFVDLPDKWDSDESYLAWCYEWLQLCIDKLKGNGSMYVMSSTQNMSWFDIFLRERITVLSRIVWYYDSSGVQAKRHFGSLYEPILHCVKDSRNYTFNFKDILVEAKTGAVRKLVDYRKRVPVRYNSKKVPGNVWQIPRVRYRMEEYEEHPTQKPMALLERIIRVSSNRGDTVLDPFAGTFTTSFVAKHLGRKSIGIEIQQEYIKIGLRRLQIASQYNGQPLEKRAKSFKRSPNSGQMRLNSREVSNGT